MKSKHMKPSVTDVADDFDDVEEDSDETIRAKWLMDGAKTLEEAAAQLREFADWLDERAAEGWLLGEPVADDYGHIFHPALEIGDAD